VRERWTRQLIIASPQRIIGIEKLRVHRFVSGPKMSNDVETHIAPGSRFLAESVGRVGRIARIRILQMNDLVNQSKCEIIPVSPAECTRGISSLSHESREQRLRYDDRRLASNCVAAIRTPAGNLTVVVSMRNATSSLPARISVINQRILSSSPSSALASTTRSLDRGAVEIQPLAAP
jgi:hypothetical protein